MAINGHDVPVVSAVSLVVKKPFRGNQSREFCGSTGNLDSLKKPPLYYQKRSPAFPYIESLVRILRPRLFIVWLDFNFE